MKIQLCSDLHLDHYRVHRNDKNGWPGLMEKVVPQTDADVLVVAGDVGKVGHTSAFLHHVAGRYRHVVYVAGNHEYYDTTRGEFWDKLTAPSNVHCLDNASVTLDGVKFVGSSLWFPDTPNARQRRGQINDFWCIERIEGWIWAEFERSRAFLDTELEPGCVMVTHHLPSVLSVAPRFKDSPLNCYFVGDVSDLIAKHRPALALHGHTHLPCDYMLGSTRVLCNPLGYPGEERARPPVVVEIEPKAGIAA
jgi:Icc-related predicted phosphoesterase